MTGAKTIAIVGEGPRGIFGGPADRALAKRNESMVHDSIVPAMADATDSANVIIRPPIAWAVAVLGGLALNWLLPLPFVPATVPAGWLGATVFALALALFTWMAGKAPPLRACSSRYQA